jgi:hypothetical protein
MARSPPQGFPLDARGAGFGFVSACSKLGGLTQPNIVAALLPPSHAHSPPHAPPPAPPAAPPALGANGVAPPPVPPLVPPLTPSGHTSLYIIGLVFTASWGVALGATIVQWARHNAAFSRQAAEAEASTVTTTEPRTDDVARADPHTADQ